METPLGLQVRRIGKYRNVAVEQGLDLFERDSVLPALIPVGAIPLESDDANHAFDMDLVQPFVNTNAHLSTSAPQ